MNTVNLTSFRENGRFNCTSIDVNYLLNSYCLVSDAGNVTHAKTAIKLQVESQVSSSLPAEFGLIMCSTG